MTLDASRSRRRTGGLLAAAALAGTILVACGPGTGAGTPRPTDPRVILSNAITATAALPSFRLHGELVASVGALLGGPNNATMTGALDADVDLATRQFAGRVTSTMPANLGGNGGAAQRQVADIILTRDAAFSRDSQTGRWTKSSSGLGNGGPTNAEVATMISNLLSNPAMTFELQDATPCTLGTCDHVIAHIDGQTLANAIGALSGAPAGANAAGLVPDFDVDVRVDQASGVISELRTSIAMAGTSEQILVTLSNPGEPVQIAAPPAALVDDFSNGFNGGGGGGVGPVPTIGPAESMILDEVGNELESAMPGEPLPSLP